MDIIVNEREEMFLRLVDKDRFKILRSGYPDFTIVSRTTGRLFFVEVKSRHQISQPNLGLNKKQREMIYHLMTDGHKCLIWSPGSEFIDPTLNESINKTVFEKMTNTAQQINHKEIKQILNTVERMQHNLEKTSEIICTIKQLVNHREHPWVLQYVMPNRNVLSIIKDLLSGIDYPQHIEPITNDILKLKQQLNSILNKDNDPKFS